MRKILLIAVSIFVLSASPSLAIYREGEGQVTPAEGEAMLMSTTSENTATRNTRMEAKDAMKSSILAARDEFRTKVKGIKDVRKQKIVEGLDTRINEMNKKKTDWMTERLNRLSAILEKAKSDANANADDVAAAETAISEAKEAVTTQAAKDYVMEVTTETALKTDARALIKEFVTDIKAVHEKMRAAQMAVVKVAQGTGMMRAKPTVTPVAE